MKALERQNPNKASLAAPEINGVRRWQMCRCSANPTGHDAPEFFTSLPVTGFTGGPADDDVVAGAMQESGNSSTPPAAAFSAPAGRHSCDPSGPSTSS